MRSHVGRHFRCFSTTRALGNSNNGTSGPNGFPGGFGGFGRQAGGSLGSFGVKKAASSDSSAQNEGLLPHERAARQNTASSQPANPSETQSAGKRSNGSGSGSKLNTRKNGNRSTEHQKHADKSKSVLTNIFNKQKRRGHPNTGTKATSTPGNTAEHRVVQEGQKQSDSGPQSDQPAWGGFSNRKARTFVNESTSSFGKDPGRTAFGSFSNRKIDTQSEPSKSGGKGGKSGSGDGVWGELMRSRRVGRPTTGGKKKLPAAEPEQDFWTELEGRVNPPTIKRKEATLETTTAVEEAKQEESEAPRRKSRFEIDSESSGKGGKKSNKRKKSRREKQRDEDMWDDAEAQRWEEIQRRKEEKRLRKLQQEQEMEEQATPILLPEFISVYSLARSLKQQSSRFLHDLEEMGFENMTNDTIMTGETASLIAMEYGFEPTVDDGSQRDIRPRPVPEDVSSLPSRPPIVTIMGHVDHGKTTLLDWLRKSSVAAQEHGGITQHIGAFVVKMSSGKPITFLDTPGHAAFLTMRQRGANVTDIVVLVVAADDSVKPQTLEALRHANNAKVPIVVAINKIDKEEARVEQVKADLSRHGVQIEDYGGDVQVVCVSGKTGRGMEDLEENIVTLSEILDTRAEQDGMAEGWVLESSVKQVGKVATVLIKRGTLRTGDFIVAGKSWARVRSLRNEAGVELTEAPPGTPVEVLGWRDLPEAGEQVLQAPDEDKAKTAIEYRDEMADRLESSAYLADQEQRQREKAAAEAAAAAAAEAEEGGEIEDTGPRIITQNLVVKADVAGSVEAVCASVLEQGNNEVQSKILRSGTGQVSEYDVDHASTSRSIIVNFNSPIQPHIKLRAIEAGVRIIDHSVIYHLVDETRGALSDLLPKNVSYRVQGEADVLQVFPINIKGRLYRSIAGCRVRNGSIKKTSLVKVLRKGEVIYDGQYLALSVFTIFVLTETLGKIDTLKHVKKNVMEMGKGSECGIGFDGFEKLEIDDQVQTYEVVEEKRHL